MFQAFPSKINLCMACHKRPAKIKFLKVQDGNLQEVMICPICAQSIAKEEKSGAHIKLDHVVKSLLRPEGSEEGGGKMLPALSGGSMPRADLTCPSCGLSYASYRPSLMLGCSECYRAFGEQLLDDLSRIHGAARHSGRRPKRAPTGSGQSAAVRNEMAGEAAARVSDLEPPTPAPADTKPARRPEKEVATTPPATPKAAPTGSLREQLRKLRGQLDEAVQLEEFAEAARLRDSIRDLEGKLKDG